MKHVDKLARNSQQRNTKKINILKKGLFVAASLLTASSLYSTALAAPTIPRKIIAGPTAQAFLSTGSGLDRGNLPEGAAKIGYGIIPNGATLNSNLTDNIPITFQNINGVRRVLYNSTVLQGTGLNSLATPIAFFSNPNYNVDGFFHHFRLNNDSTMSWEDLFAGGDLNYSDALISYNLQKSDGSIIPLAANGYHAIDDTMKLSLLLSSLQTSRNPGFNNLFYHFFEDNNGNLLPGIIDFANTKTDIGKSTVLQYQGLIPFDSGNTLQYTQGTTVVANINNLNIAAVDVSLLAPGASPKLQFNNSASLGSVKNTGPRIDNLLVLTLSPNTTVNITGTSGVFADGSSVGSNNYSGLGTIDGTPSGSGNLSINNQTTNVSLTQKIGGTAPINSLSVIAGTLATVEDINMTGNLIIDDQNDNSSVGNLRLGGTKNTINLTANNIYFTGAPNQLGGIITLDSSNGTQNFYFNTNQFIAGTTFQGIFNLNANNNPLAFGAASDIGNSGQGALHAVNVNTNNQQTAIINPNIYARGVVYSGTGLATFNGTVNLQNNPSAALGSFNVNGTGTVLLNQGLSGIAGINGNLIYNADGEVQVAANKNINANAYAAGNTSIGTITFLGGNSQWNGIASGPAGSMPIKRLNAGAGNLTLLGGIYNINETQGTGTSTITLPSGTTINGNFNSTGGQKVNFDARSNVVINGTIGSNLYPVGNIKMTAQNTNLTLQNNVFANQLEFSGNASVANLGGVLTGNVLFSSIGILNINSNWAGVNGNINGNGNIVVGSNLTNVNLNGNIGNLTPIKSMILGANSSTNLNSDVHFSNPNNAAIVLGQNAVLNFVGDRNLIGTGTEYIGGASDDNGKLVFVSGSTNLTGISMGVAGRRLDLITILNNSTVTTDSSVNVKTLIVGDPNVAPATLIMKPNGMVTEVIDSFTLAHPNSTYQIDSSNATGGLVFNQNTIVGQPYDDVGVIIVNANNNPVTVNGAGTFGDSDTQRIKKLILMGNAAINVNIDTHAVEIIDATGGNVNFNVPHTSPVNPAVLVINNNNQININANTTYALVDFKGYNANINVANNITLTSPLADSTNRNSGSVTFIGNGSLIGNVHSIPNGIGVVRAGAAGSTVVFSGQETIKDVQGISNTGNINFADGAVLNGNINLAMNLAATNINFAGNGAIIGSIGAGSPVGNVNLNGPGTISFLFSVKGNSLNINHQGATAKIYDDLLIPVEFAALSTAQGTLDIVLSDVNITETINGQGNIIIEQNLANINFSKSIGLDSAINTIVINDNSQVTTNASIVANSTSLIGNATLFFNRRGAVINTLIDGGNLQINDNVQNIYFKKAIGNTVGIRNFVVGNGSSAIITDNLSVDSASNAGINLGNNAELYINGSNILINSKIDGPGSITVGNAPIEANFVHSSHVIFNREIGSTNAPMYFALSDDSSARFNKTANFTNDIIVGDNSLVQFADNLTADFINFTNNSGSIEFINPNPMQVTALIGLEANHPKNMIVSGNDVTINSGQTLTNAITFSNSKMPATLSLINATVYNGGIYTTGDLIHTIAFGNTSIIGTGDVGGPNNRLKIELFRQNINAGFGLVVNSKDFYANVTTKEDNNGALFFSAAEGIALNIGTPDAKLQGVYVNENITAKGNIYTNDLRVRGKTVTFTGDSATISSDQILLNSSSELLFKGDNSKVTGVINSNLGTDTTITVAAHNVLFNGLIGSIKTIKNFIVNSSSSATLNENINLDTGGVVLNQDSVLTLASNSNIITTNGAVINFVGNNSTLEIVKNTDTQIQVPLKVDNSGYIKANNLTAANTLLIDGPIGSLTENKSLLSLQATGGGNIKLSGGDVFIKNIDLGDKDSNLILANTNGNYKFNLSHAANRGNLIIAKNAVLKEGTLLGSASNPLNKILFSGDNQLLVDSVDLYATGGIEAATPGQGELRFIGSSIVGAAVGQNNIINDIVISGPNHVVTFLKKVSLSNKLLMDPSDTVVIADDIKALDIDSTAGQGHVEFINTKSRLTVTGNLGLNHGIDTVTLDGRSVTVTKDFFANKIDFTNANQVAALKILGNTDLTNVDVTTNSTRRNHDVHVSNNQTIKGKWGDKDHLMGGIRLLGDLTIVIDTPYYFGGINPSADNTGTVELKGDAYSLGRFNSNSLKKVIFSDNVTSHGVIKAQTIEVADGKIATFDSGFKIEDEDNNPDIVRPHLMSTGGMTLGTGSTAIFKNNSLLDGAILAKNNGSGSVYFFGNAEVRGLMGDAQAKLASVNFTGINNRDSVRLVKNITANNINLDNVTATLPYTIRLSGAVNAKNTDFNLNSEILILPNSTSTFSGDIKINTTFDGTNGGHITVDGLGSKLDFSNADSLTITVTANTTVGVNEEKSYILFLKANGGSVVQNNPNNIQVISNDANRYVHWIYNPADRKLIGVLNPSMLLDDITNNPNINGDDAAVANHIVIHADDNIKMRDLANMLGLMSEEEVVDTLKRLQPDTNNIPSSLREDLASLSALIDDRLDRIGNRNNITQTELGSGVAAGDAGAVDYGFWFSPFYDQANQRLREAKSGYKSHSFGATFGYDTQINDFSSIGAAISYVHTNINQRDAKTGDKTKVDSAVLSLYGMKEFSNDWFMQGNGSLGYSFVKNSEKRNLGANISAQAKSKYRVNSYSLQALTGYDYRITRSFMATPTIGMRYDRFGQISYSENGADLQNLTVKKRPTNRLEGILGAKLTLAKEINNISIISEVHSFINYNFINKAGGIRVNIAGVDNSLPITVIKPSKLSYNLGGGIEMARGRFEIGLVYDAIIEHKYISHQGTMKLKVSL